MRRHIYVSALIIVVVALALPTREGWAHHSYSPYNRKEVVSVSGEITEIRWRNPHVLFVVTTPEQIAYRMEWRTVRQLRKNGVPDNTLHLGDQVTIEGSPAKDPDNHALSLLHSVTRTTDGWRWARIVKKNGKKKRRGEVTWVDVGESPASTQR